MGIPIAAALPVRFPADIFASWRLCVSFFFSDFTPTRNQEIAGSCWLFRLFIRINGAKSPARTSITLNKNNLWSVPGTFRPTVNEPLPNLQPHKRFVFPRPLCAFASLRESLF